MNEERFTAERRKMVLEQLQERDIRDPGVLRAMLAVPRHRFVPPDHRHLAYDDGPLPIGSEQTISQPYIVAYMIQHLALRGAERVLDVGTGSGYQAAVLAHLVAEVHSIERHPGLARRAERLLRGMGYSNIWVHVGDGSAGLAEHAPFDGIIVAAAAPATPQPLLEQLTLGGRLVIPVGSMGSQYLERWTRQEQGFFRERLAPVAFVPLLGDYGWKPAD